MPRLLSDVDLLSRLVAFPTVSAQPVTPLVDFLCDYLDRPGLSLRRLPGPQPGKENLLVRLGPDSETADGLTLNGHMDVVPADEPGWSSDPFTLTDRNGRLTARGACDMKGFVALAVNRLAALDPASLTSELTLLLTFDEEVGSLGAAHLAANWPADESPLPRCVLVGEPTGLRAVRMHKGHLKLRITCPGRSAHSGFPHLGRNAIEHAGRVLAVLTDLREELESQRVQSSDCFPQTPWPALNIARIAGGSAFNVIPESCIIDVGLRPLPGMESQTLVDQLTEAVARCDDGPWKASVALVNDNPAFLLGEESRWYRQVAELVNQRESRGVSFSSDAGILARDLGLECVLFGPGSIDVAHQPDEYIDAADLHRGGELLDQLIDARCRRSPQGA